MLLETTGPDLPVPANIVQMTDVQCEGNKMATPPSRRLPLEVLIDIADQVSFSILFWVELCWTEIF